MKIQRKYTWKRQPLDKRDYKFTRLVDIKSFKTISLPISTSLRYWCSEIEDQQYIGSCTANAWSGLLEYNAIRWNGLGGALYKDLSRLFIYYNERVIEHTIHKDSGASLRDGVQTLYTNGVCIENEWPYDLRKWKIQPSTQCYTDALKNVIHSYYSLTTLNDMKVALANGYAFVYGFDVYSSFESDIVTNTGIVPVPNIKTENYLGGHAVCCIGYDDTTKRFLCRNSWGKNWGMKGDLAGYFTMPYDYITNPNLAGDYWTVVKDV